MVPSPPSVVSGLPNGSTLGAERGERRFRRVTFLRLIFAGAAFRRFARLGLVFGRFALDSFFGCFGFFADFFFFAI